MTPVGWVRAALGVPARRSPSGRKVGVLSGPVGVLRILLLCAAGLGLGYLPFDLADQHRARELERDGRSVSVTEARVHVGYVPARGGGWYEVDQVQVRIPGLGDDRWVDVTGLPNVQMNSDVKGELWREGWQEPTGATSYRPPMDVVYQVGRNVDAMTPGDIARWSVSDDATISAGLGAGGLVGVGLTFSRRGVRVLRRRRAGVARTSRPASA